MTDDRVEEVKKNILSPSQWVRILYMVFYAVACWVTLIVLPVIVVCQVVISLISGEDNKNLREFGGKLSAYLHSALDYLLYVEETKPWPFNSNEGDDLSDEDSTIYSSPAAGSASANDTQAATTSADDVFADISFTEEVVVSGIEHVEAEESDPAAKVDEEPSETGDTNKADEQSRKDPS